MEEMLYKYTTLESLALILSSNKIRLNPLTKLDDIQEAETSDGIEFGKYIFISSWMNQPSESIAMWKLYSNMNSGVRIGLKKYPFVKYTVTEQDAQCFFPESKVIGCQADLILPLNECFNNRYTVLNFIYEKSLEKVEYTDSVKHLSPQILSRTDNGIQLAFNELGKYKNTYWEFQREERYILRFLPINVKEFNDPNLNYADIVYKALIKEEEFLPFYDLEISYDAFCSMEITLSPQFSSGNLVILNNLLEKYNPSAQVRESALKDRVRL